MIDSHCDAVAVVQSVAPKSENEGGNETRLPACGSLPRTQLRGLNLRGEYIIVLCAIDDY